MLIYSLQLKRKPSGYANVYKWNVNLLKVKDGIMSYLMTKEMDNMEISYVDTECIKNIL